MKAAAPQAFEGDIRCLCGGVLVLGVDGMQVSVKHSWPPCSDYDAIETADDAADLSVRCRAALGDFRPA